MSAIYQEPTEAGGMIDQNVSDLLGAYRSVSLCQMSATYKEPTDQLPV